MSRAATGITVAVLIGSLTSCGSGLSDKAPSITAPEVFYLRPVGDRSGPHDKAPFAFSADNGKTLTVEVLPGAETAVVLHKSGN